jgi:hypothetical protein
MFDRKSYFLASDVMRIMVHRDDACILCRLVSFSGSYHDLGKNFESRSKNDRCFSVPKLLYLVFNRRILSQPEKISHLSSRHIMTDMLSC